jgi:hypothetical protein
MNVSRQFRRALLLLLSLTLSMQAMAVASFGECHRVKALAALAATVTSTTHTQHGDASAHHDAATGHGKHRPAATHNNDTGERTTQDDSRIKCAACAGCHLCSAVLTDARVVADIPAAESALFPESIVPRVRNVANGLERPPRA